MGVFSVAAGAMISSGLFVLPGLAFAKAGPAVILSYALASLLMIPSMLSKAELATAMPKSGGSYFFIERSLGPLPGTFAGFANWVSISLKSAFALVGIGTLGEVLLPHLGLKGTALAACAFFALVNLVSLKGAGRLQILLVLGLLLMIGIYVGKGMGSVEVTRFSPFMPHGSPAVFAVAGMVFVSFGGLTKVVSVAEEVRNPARNLPLGMFLAFAIVSLLYVAVVFVTVGAVDPHTLAGNLAPIAAGADAALGPVGVLLLETAAFLAFATTANSGILAAARSPMAMSRDGLLPAFLSKTNRRFSTPHTAIIATAVFMGAVVAFLSVEDLVKTASTMMILMFMMVNAATIIMRQSGLQNYRPTFRAPLYPWLQVAAIILYGFLIVEMGRVPLILTGAFALAAGIWYLAYVRPRIERESAFVFLVKNILAKDIGRSGLEDELKHITLERDEVSLDRFDRLVTNAGVIDSGTCMSAKEMFKAVAAKLAPRVAMDKDALYRLFLKREMESSTVVHPGIAIPHVVLQGEGIFDLLLVRCRSGVVFSELHQPVTTVFVLAGTMDERNYHLRALMTIAHIIEEPGFIDRWLKARGEEELKDMLLLSKRRREAPPPPP
ncbi:MAG: amino acid permease [Planctomycetes bacterium]|nr:amino acid permease [Planctomycetota bacterium]